MLVFLSGMLLGNSALHPWRYFSETTVSISLNIHVLFWSENGNQDLFWYSVGIPNTPWIHRKLLVFRIIQSSPLENSLKIHDSTYSLKTPKFLYSRWKGFEIVVIIISFPGKSTQLVVNIANRGEWLWSQANIKRTNSDGKIYSGEQFTTVHNLLFCVVTICVNYVTKKFLFISSSVSSKQLQGQGQKRNSWNSKYTSKYESLLNLFPLFAIFNHLEQVLITLSRPSESYPDHFQPVEFQS